jgi:hypothetical protein
MMAGLMNRLAATALVALLAFATGCAAGGPEAPGDPGLPGTTRISVENFHPGSEDLEVFIVPDGGVARTRMGAVPRGDTGTFTFDGDRGPYRLIAVRPVGEITSDRVNINHTTSLTWNIQQNRVVVSRR